MNQEESGHILRIRGLPWQSSREEVVGFFEDCMVKGGVEGVHMTLSPHGRPSGEAYVEMESEEDAHKGLLKHMKSMGTRYIEVFPSVKSEMDWALRRNGKSKINVDPNLDGFVRLRGLPFESNEDDIRRFFEGLEIVDRGIILTMDQRGKPTGEAYVQFASKEIAERAMSKHKEKIRHRYIEIFKSTPHEFALVSGHKYSRISDLVSRYGNYGEPYGGGYMGTKRHYSLSNNRSAPYDRDFNNRNFPSPMGKNYSPQAGVRRPYSSLDGFERGPSKRFAFRESGSDDLNADRYDPTRHIVHMRGLPYKANELDIVQFFLPYQPIAINLHYDESGRPSGKADVEFKTHEQAEGAMSKDNSNMQHRYIELFLHSRPTSHSELGSPEFSAVSRPNLTPTYDEPKAIYSSSFRPQAHRNDPHVNNRDSAYGRSTSSSGTYLVRLPSSSSVVGPRLSMRDFLRSRVHIT